MLGNRAWAAFNCNRVICIEPPTGRLRADHKTVVCLFPCVRRQTGILRVIHWSLLLLQTDYELCTCAVSGIQRLVLAGRLGEAIELTDQLYPRLLERNANLLFMLKCRQFIEIVSGSDPGNCSCSSTRSPSVSGSRSRSGSARSSPVASPIHRRNSPALFRSGVGSPSRRSTVSPGKSGRHSPNIASSKHPDEASMNITNGVTDVTVAHFVPHSIMECSTDMDTSETVVHMEKAATNGFSANGDQDMSDIDEDADMG